MNIKKLTFSEYGLSKQGLGLSQHLEFQTVVFDSFLDARGGNGGSGKGGGKGDTTEPEITDTYVSGDDTVADSQEFNIRIDFYGDLWTEELKEDFIASADFLSSLIMNDIAPDGYDDITIDASLVDIDGVNGVLGRAGPSTVWTANSLTATGLMEFDVADAETYDNLGLWDDIVLHEMIHTLGLGTLWEYQGLLTTEVIDDNGTKKPTDDTVGYVYHGEQANFYSNELFATDVVIEEEGGSGTAGGHWDEDTYFNELMTGYIDDNNYLSDMTYGALEDLGYQVNYDVSPDLFFV